jgi:5-methyltetrahydrofolate--homocysteine methyltransferase
MVIGAMHAGMGVLKPMLAKSMATTRMDMKNTIQAIEGADLKTQMKMIVGGAPLTEKFAREIGADGYAPDAASAVDLVKLPLSE